MQPTIDENNSILTIALDAAQEEEGAATYIHDYLNGRRRMSRVDADPF